MDQNIIAEPSDSREKKPTFSALGIRQKKLGYLFMKKNSTYHDITLGRCSFHRDFIGGLVDWKFFFFFDPVRWFV